MRVLEGVHPRLPIGLLLEKRRNICQPLIQQTFELRHLFIKAASFFRSHVSGDVFVDAPDNPEDSTLKLSKPDGVRELRDIGPMHFSLLGTVL